MSSTSSTQEGPETTLSHRYNPTVLAVVQMGYNHFTVEYVFKKKIKETGCAFSKASLLYEAVIKHINEAEGDSKEDHKLKEENRLLKEEKTCKICLDEEINIVFLPCWHFLSCVSCAPSLKTCPLCNSQILETVRTYKS